MKVNINKLTDFINSHPAFTDDLPAATGLPAADVDDPVAMAPQIRHMQETIERAAKHPDKFYYAVLVIGKDGKRPIMHGACSPALAAMTASLFAAPEELALVDRTAHMLKARLTDMWHMFVTGKDIPEEFWEDEPLPVDNDIDLAALEAFYNNGGSGFGINAGADDEAERLRHADDGCPHAGD